MILKSHDILTVFGSLACKAYFERGEKSAFNELVRTAQSLPRLNQELSFDESPLRFLAKDGDSLKPTTIEKFAQYFKTPSQFLSRYEGFTEDEQKQNGFVASEAFHELSRDFGPMVFIHAADGLVRFYEGKSGRKYLRSAQEIGEFFKSHPEEDNLYRDIEIRARRRIRSNEDLVNFINLDPAIGIDWLIDILNFNSNFYFKSFDEVKDKEAHILELNPKVKATIEVSFIPVPADIPHNQSTDAEQKLKTALENLIAFADKNGGADSESKPFREGLKILTTPPSAESKLWSMAGLSSQNHRLFQAAITSDGFGEMGTWNDIYAHDREAYKAVSNHVILAMLDAVSASVNQKI